MSVILPLVGNIYKGRVLRVLPGMQSAFIDIGFEKAAFLYVDDAANIISKSVNFPQILNPINIYGEEISVKDLLKLICDIIDVDYKSVSWDSNMPDGVPRKVLAKGKLDQLIDYQFVSFKEGLKKTIDWYIANKKEADKRQ